MVESDAQFRIREIEFAAWMRMIDREDEWLIAHGRMPLRGSGLSAVEAERWQIYPTYDTGTAAELLQIDEGELFRAVESGEIEYVSHYDMILLPFSGLDAFCRRRPPLAMPAGGGWDDLPAGEWWEWHWKRARRLRNQFRDEPEKLQMAEEELANDERLYLGSGEHRVITQGESRVENPHQ